MKKLLIASIFLATVVHGQNICIDPTSGFTTAPQCSGGAMRVKVDASSMVINNDTYIQGRNAADSADIDVWKVDATDDTVLNCDSGDVIKLSEAGTAGITIDPSTNGFTFASPAELGTAGSATDGISRIALTDGTDKWSLVPGVNLLTLAAGTSDGTDDQQLCITGGGACLNDGRGAYLQLYGRDAGSAVATLSAAGTISIASSASVINLQTTSLNRFTVEADGDLAQDATNGGNIVMAKAGTGVISGLASLHADVGGTPTVFATDSAGHDGIVVFRGANNAYGPAISFLKTKATDGSADVAVSNGVDLGHIYFHGADGASFRRAAEIHAEVDGNVGSSDMPGRLTFLVSPDGSATPAEAMRITSKGEVLVKGVAVASLPASCTPGALMRATDSNDCSAGGGDGSMCICVAAGTWALAHNY